MGEGKSVFVLLPGSRAAGDAYQLLQEGVALAAGNELGLRLEVGRRGRPRRGPRATRSPWACATPSRPWPPAPAPTPCAAPPSSESTRVRPTGSVVDEGTLTASVEAPANAGLALTLLHRFWREARPLPLRSFTEPRPYPR